MYKVALINMPFADANRPSVSLTQLKYLLDQIEGVEAEIHYLNQDALIYFGKTLVQIIADQYTSGLGDWVFRQIAFPGQTDNFQQYLGRHFPQKDDATKGHIRDLLRKRHGLPAFLDQLIGQYHLDQADIVGFTSMFSQNVASFALAKKLKDRKPEIITIMGGANCETPMGEELVKHVPQVDFVFSGPALKSLPEFVNACREGNREACHAIKGVFSKRNVDQLPKRERIGEELPLDVPIPLDYRAFVEGFDSRFPELKMTKTLTFETSRGCWWGERSHCTFCGLNGASMGYRAMNAGLAIQQFDQLFQYAETCNRFSCVDNIMPKNYIAEVFPQIDPPDHVVIFYEVKADLSESDLKTLSEKRVKSVQPGIEALASSTLKLMKKGTTAFGNIRFLKHCVLWDIQPEWNLLVGFPGEDEDVFQKYLSDLPTLIHLHPPGGCFPVRFDRFSPYFMKAGEYGLDLQPYEFYQFVYPFDPDSIRNMAYYFQDQTYEAAYTRKMTKYIDQLRERVTHWQSRIACKDGKLPPALYFKGADGDEIYDSRSGEPKVHHVGPLGRNVLDILEKPKSLSSIASGLDGIPESEVERVLRSLGELDLIFQEGTRFLSLVLPRQGLGHERRRQETGALAGALG